MSTHTSTSKVRMAALVASAALGTAALVAAAPAAEAKPANEVTTGYTCVVPVLGNQTIPVTTKLTLPKAKKGVKVGAKTIKLTVVLPESLVTPLRDVLGVKKLSGTATDAKLSVGALKVALNNVKFPPTAVPASGTMTLHGKGKTAAFTPTKAGTYTVKVPTKFTFTSYDQDGNVIGGSGFPCTAVKGDPTKIGSFTVTS